MMFGGTLRKSSLSLSERLRLYGKVAIGHLCLFRLTQRPILIFSTRRSGSTLLMHMIHSQPGVDYIDEPLNLWRMQDILDGKLRFRHRGNLLDAGRTFIVRRLVVKNINATPLIDWFTKNFEADIVYLFRHPCAVAESLQRRDWKSTAEAYLKDETFCEHYLSEELYRYAHHILSKGSPLQRYVLEWCLDNIVPLRLYRERSWFVVTYEELVLKPKQVTELICSRLDLPDPQRMLRVLYHPSRTTSRESQRVLRRRGPQSLVTRWLEGVDRAELQRAQDVLDAFNVNIYRADSAYPNLHVCHFGPFENEVSEVLKP